MLLAVLGLGVAGVVIASGSGGGGEAGDCGHGGRTLDGIRFDDAVAEVAGADGDRVRLCVLVADTPDRQQHGLMRVTNLDPYDGMVFVNRADSTSGFWMRNTPMPLSIAWFAADGRFVSAADMAPCLNQATCPTYEPAGAYRLALEVPQGRLEGHGVGAGARLELVDADEGRGTD